MTTIRTREPRELLALIPYQLGFTPQDSAVVVSVRGDRQRIGLVARVDLPDLADPGAGPDLARSLVGHLLADGAGAVVLVLYVDGPGWARGDERVASAVGVVQDEAEPVLGPVAVWVVGPTGYRAWGCTDPACCPPEGRALSDLESTQVGAHMVVAGRQIAPSRQELAPVPEVSAAARRAARRAAERWAARRAAAADPVSVHRWRRACLTAWREDLARCAAEPGVAIEPTRLGRHLVALDDVLVRDAVLLGLVPGRGRLADRVVAGYSGDEIGRALGAILDPVSGTVPDPVLVDPARELVSLVASHAARHRRAPAATLLGLMAWWEGDGGLAGVHLDRALAAQEGYRLAELLAATLASGMPPGWVRARGA